jgi:hypothetical protein
VSRRSSSCPLQAGREAQQSFHQSQKIARLTKRFRARRTREVFVRTFTALSSDIQAVHWGLRLSIASAAITAINGESSVAGSSYVVNSRMITDCNCSGSCTPRCTNSMTFPAINRVAGSSQADSNATVMTEIVSGSKARPAKTGRIDITHLACSVTKRLHAVPDAPEHPCVTVAEGATLPYFI